MTDRKNTKDELQSLKYRDRLNAIADDLTSEQDRYRDVNPHDLAKLMRVPCPNPGDGWTYIKTCIEQSVEEWIEVNGAAEELARHLEGHVEPTRLADLEYKLSQVDEYSGNPDLSFLKSSERLAIEAALMEHEMDEIEGGYVVARFCLGSPKGVEFWFEGDIEDDGECIHMRTPYDHRDGQFSEIGPMSEEWSDVPWEELLSSAVH